MAGYAVTIDEMERKVIQCLNDIPFLHIWWWVLLFSFWFPFALTYFCVPLVMQTDLHILFQLTMLAFQDRRLFGLIESTIATIPYLQIL
jgi:hypothetical protein